MAFRPRRTDPSRLEPPPLGPREQRTALDRPDDRTPAAAYDQPDAGESVRLVERRLPRPARRVRRQRTIAIRAAGADDAAACAALDATYTSHYVWQLDTRQDGDELRVSFRQVRLPRELRLVTEHRPPALPRGSARRGMLWLVAEEVEWAGPAGDVPPPSDPMAGGAPPGPEPSGAGHPAGTPAQPPPARGLWSHALRRSAGASSIQLGLPEPASAVSEAGSTREAAGRGSDAGASPDGPRGTVVGYVVVSATPGAKSAYLHTLVVDRSRRRQGIASRLLAEARRWAADQGALSLMADVAARNYPALRLLQKAGFSFCGYNDRCYADNEVAIFFAARLP